MGKLEIVYISSHSFLGSIYITSRLSSTLQNPNINSMADSSPAETLAPVSLPRISIKFCTQCKWMLRAAYVRTLQHAFNMAYSFFPNSSLAYQFQAPSYALRPSLMLYSQLPPPNSYALSTSKELQTGVLISYLFATMNSPPPFSSLH